jgi:O-antigen/teichoic acid export membrane protein
MRLTFSSLASIARSTLAERRALVLSGLASLSLRVAGLASTFAMGVILARILGPAEFGRYGLVTTLAAIGMSIGLLGTPQLAVREFSIRSARGDWAGVRWLGSSMGKATAFACLAIALLALGVTQAIDGSGKTALDLATPGALLIVFTGITALSASGLRGLGLMAKGQVMDIFARPFLSCLVLLAFVLASWPFGASLALWIQAAVAAAAAVVSLVWIRAAIPSSHGQVSAAFRWLPIALPLGAVDMLRQLDGGYGVILMGWLASDTELGLFRVAVACNVVIGMPVTILHIVLAPNLARLHSEGRMADLQQLLSWASGLMVAIIGLMTLGVIVAGRPVIEWVFGLVYGGSWLPLVLMCVAQLVFALFGMGPIVLAMCEGERHLTRIYLLAVGTGIVSAVALIPTFGAVGAAGATIISMGMVGFLSWRYGRRRLGVDSTFVPLLRTAPITGTEPSAKS